METTKEIKKDAIFANLLTLEDLNQYKITLNKAYTHMLHQGEVFFNFQSNLRHSSEHTEEDKIKQKELKIAYKAAKQEIKVIQRTKVFKSNYIEAKNILKNLSQNGDEQMIVQAEEECQTAHKILKEFHHTRREFGRGADLKKLSTYAIEVNDLKFRYNPNFPFALNGINLKIKEGNYVAIVGHNGSGKSTLSKILIGVLTAEYGGYKIFGNPINRGNSDQSRRFLGIVFQNPDNQFIGSTVEADIAFGLENKRVEQHLMQDIIVNAATTVRMQDFLKHEPLNLSGGQKQRVAIASAIALNPEILIFDEATSMLDPRGKREIKEIMLELRQKMKKTVISITHDMDEILQADQVIVMNAGEIVKTGSPKEVLSDKQFLRSIKLDIPFVGLVSEALEKQGIQVDDHDNLDQLADEIINKKK